MPTEQLYYVNPYQKACTATVLSCQEGSGGYLVTLDRTVFYPTGGGQPCDLGTIGMSRVLDVSEKDGEIVHLCEKALPVGETLACEIDWARRFMLMQQHSGEHLVSGIIHARFGYDNVGFHMGAEMVTIDFSGELSPEELHEVELVANETIWRDIPSEIFFPDAQTLQTLPYRSKKELSGKVRLVRFGEIDLCACCGLHVARSGEIGIIKLLSATRFHGGSRIELLCGGKALAYLNQIFAQNREISSLLSAKPTETAAAVKRTIDEQKETQYRAISLENRLFAYLAADYAASDNSLHFEENLSPSALRRLADAAMKQGCTDCAIFSGAEGAYQYAIAGTAISIREMNAELNGRGGGKPGFAQGSVKAKRAEIEAYFSKENRE